MRGILIVLHALGQVYIKGYKPLDHVGVNTTNSILKSLKRNNLVIESDYDPTPDQELIQIRTERIRKDINLKNKPTGQHRAKKTTTIATVFFRDPVVRAWVLENAKSKCEACDMDALFLLPDGFPFLEVHHLTPLANGGPDTIENAIALCPNCHRRCHLSGDKDLFNKKIYKKVKILIQ